MDIVERTVNDALDMCKVHQNKATVMGALRSALNAFLMSILKDEFGIRKSFKSTVLHVPTSQVVVSRIAKKVVSDPSALAPIAQFVVKAVKLEAAMSVKESAVMAPPSPPPLGLTRQLTRRRKSVRRRAQEVSIRASRRIPHHHIRVPGR